MRETRKSLVLGIIISLLLFNLISVDWVRGDTETANPSTYHKAYSGGSATGTDWNLSVPELDATEYNAVTNSDNSRLQESAGSGYYPYVRGDFNISRISVLNAFSISNITSITIKIEGFGDNHDDSAHLISCAVYDDTNAIWRTADTSGVAGIWSHNSATDANLTVTISSNVQDYISSDGIFKYSSVGIHTEGGYGHEYVDYVVLTIAYSTLTDPVLVSPTSGGTGYTITPNFDWNVSTGGTSPYTYELMVDTDLAFGSPDINATGISNSNYSYTTGLTPATVYYWKVRTKDNGGAYSSWTSTQSFTTASFASPSFVVPTAGATLTTVTPTFSWGASTGGDGNYTYELQVSLNSGFTGTAVDVTGITTTSYTMTSNLTPDTYYAKIRAKDGLGNYTAWSSTISFTATTPSTGGSSSSSTSEQAPYVPPVLTTNNDTPATTSSSSGTSVFTKYIVNPVKVIIINPLVALWDWFVGLFRGSSQAPINDVLERPIGIGKFNVPLGWILLAGLALFVLFGDGIKMPKFKVGKKIRKGGKRLW